MSNDSSNQPLHEKNTEKPSNKGIYLLPNLLTTAALFSGFYAILVAMDGMFERAVIALIIAAVLDGLDGRVARMTNTQSEFGAQYDSMSDLVAFGVAPALVAFEWALQFQNKIGWAAAFAFVACAALRLARFNVQIETTDSRYFVGLPSPAAAGTLATGVWLGASHGINGKDASLFIVALAVILAAAMVSNLRLPSFKSLDKNKVPFVVLLAIVVVLSIILINPPAVLFTIGVTYLLSGVAMSLLGKNASH